MYLARFDLGDAAWHVAAARVRPTGQDAVPTAVRDAIRRGDLARIAVRFSFAAGQLHSAILVPGDSAEATSAAVAALRQAGELEWCADRAAFDTLQADIGPLHHWLNPRGLTTASTPIALSATLATCWSELRAESTAGAVQYQVNAVRQPADAEAVRRLRKRCVALTAQAAEGRLPDRVAKGQIDLLQRRIQNPWLLDELVAAARPQVGDLLAGSLVQQSQAQGLPGVASEVLETGDFAELFQTGLDSTCFLAADDAGQAGRCWREDQFMALLARGRSAPAPSNGNTPTMRWDVFVSHASADAEAAVSLCTQLEGLGLRAWIAPRDIGPGAHYAESIIDGLERSRAVLMLVSPTALSSPHVLREIERAVSLRRSLFPVRLADVQPEGALAYLLSGCQWLDRWRQDDSAIARQLAAALGARGEFGSAGHAGT